MSTTPAVLDLSTLPSIFVLLCNITIDDLHDYEDKIYAANGPLTYDAAEARVFVGNISQKRRATFELRARSVWTEEAVIEQVSKFGSKTTMSQDGPARKRRKLSDNSTVARERRSPSSTASSASSHTGEKDVESSTFVWPDLTSHVLVLKISYLEACLEHLKLVPYEPHLIYYGKIIPKPPGEQTPPQPSSSKITRYVKADRTSPSPASQATTSSPLSFRTYQPRRFNNKRTSPTVTKSHPPKLHRTTTSEFEGKASSSPSKIPPLPDWATSEHAIYACCRSTPLNAVNYSFIKQLTTIKTARILSLDEIGVRAYSTSIASISAYPHLVQSEEEIIRLPGCNNRIAELWREWYDSSPLDSERFIQHVRDLENEDAVKILRLFYDIWGVGADTARTLYYKLGYKDLDDLVEYHWSQLKRVQQLGVKFYAEFQVPIPRAEVEFIAATIHRHARKCCDVPESNFNTPHDVTCVIVGGYRRGKTESGDVDVIISHRDAAKTKDLVVAVVQSLEEEGWITHTLTMQTSMSGRDQQTLPYKGSGGGHHHHGFDTLDKALCVWQDINFQPPSSTSSANPGGKNPNIHRRVDIILSPWRTVGCAILGWSGGTTFQRDLRRFASKVKGWKFDSSGIRDRGSGMVVDLEAPVEGKDEANGWEDRERRVMEGLGVGWRGAEERCTG